MTALMHKPHHGWVAEHRRAAQTAANETERKTQTLNIFIKSIRQTYLSSADAARSPIAVFDLEMSW